MKSIFKTYRQNIGTYFHNLEAYPQKIGGYLVLLFIIHFFTVEPAVAQKSFLQSQGTATQLIVDGKPFLILGGELGNSSASSVQDIERIFPKLQRMGLNTVLVPAYWDLTEPTEGHFGFYTYRQSPATSTPEQSESRLLMVRSLEKLHELLCSSLVQRKP